MGTSSRILLWATLVLFLAACGRVEVGIDRTPTPPVALEATIAAMAADNARLATQVAAMSAATPVPPAVSQPGSPAASSTVAPTPTFAPPPTTAAQATDATPDSPAATRAPATEPTAAPTAAPTPAGPVAEITTDSINLRSGPGTAYPIVGQGRRGDKFALLGRTAGGDWLQVGPAPAAQPGPQDRQSWVSAALVTVRGDVKSVAVVTNIPAPPPSATAPASRPLPTPPPPSATSAVAPTCDFVPIRGFGLIWGTYPAVASALGCPSSYPQPGEVGTDAAVQVFEHGLMLWLAADSQQSSDPVYALFDDGTYQRFPDLGPADPAVVGTTDPGFSPVGPRFSKAYWEGTGARVRERLGRATGPETDSPAAYQQFMNGRMFWTKVIDKVFVLYDYWVYPPGQPSFRIRTWNRYEDTWQ